MVKFRVGRSTDALWVLSAGQKLLGLQSTDVLGGFVLVERLIHFLSVCADGGGGVHACVWGGTYLFMFIS